MRRQKSLDSVATVLVVFLMSCAQGDSTAEDATRQLQDLRQHESLDTSFAVDLLELLEEIRISNPRSYDSLSTIVIFAAQMHLGKLGFGLSPFTGTADSTTRHAVRTFESLRGLPVTGDILNVQTLSLIFAESSMLARAERTPAPSLKTFGASEWDQGYVMVQGTWITEGQASPFHEVVRIECFRSRMQCEILFSRLRRDDHTLTIDREMYDVALWDDNDILSKPRTYPCARYLLQLNRVEESAMTIRQTASTSGLCKHMDAAPLVNRIATWQEATELDVSDSLVTQLYYFGPKLRRFLEQREP